MNGIPGNGTGVTGRYSDVVTDSDGAVVQHRHGTNTICPRMWPLVAGLLRQDPALGSPLYLAVGRGCEDWDRTGPEPRPGTVRLVAEITRQPLPADTIRYLDATGRPADAPTCALRLTARFGWPTDPPTLREFGLFGGDASAAPESGYQLNHVVHPPLALRPGDRLTRTIDLVFGADGASAPSPDHHWLGLTALDHVDGVGRRLAERLATVGVATVRDLATQDLPLEGLPMPLPVVAALRGKCRLILQSAMQLPMGVLADHRPETVLRTTAGDLTRSTGTPLDVVERVQELLIRLEICLDHTYLNSFRIADLAKNISPRPSPMSGTST